MRAAKILILMAIIVAAGVGGGYYYTQILAPKGQQAAGAPTGGPPPGAARGGRPGGPPGMGSGRPSPVNVAVVRKQEFGDRIEAVGTASANESITVTARVQGIVRSINFEDGAVVDKGTEIAAIDAGEPDARLNVELANLEEQRKEQERIRGLAQSGNVSQARVDQQVSAVKRAEANVAAARARVADYRITAPFTGVLGTRKVSLGALVSPGAAITTLDDISTIKLDFAVPENFIAALRPGLEIEATSTAYANAVFKGSVVAVDSRVDPVTRSVAIRASIPNEDKRLRPGMLMVVDLIKDRSQSLMIPEQALIPENDSHIVFTVGPDNTVSRIQVTIGRRQLGQVEILEGLSEGDVVVTEGSMDLRPNAKVQILNRASLSPAPSAENAQTRSPG